MSSSSSCRITLLWNPQHHHQVGRQLWFLQLPLHQVEGGHVGDWRFLLWRQYWVSDFPMQYRKDWWKERILTFLTLEWRSWLSPSVLLADSTMKCMRGQWNAARSCKLLHLIHPFLSSKFFRYCFLSSDANSPIKSAVGLGWEPGDHSFPRLVQQVKWFLGLYSDQCPWPRWF